MKMDDQSVGKSVSSDQKTTDAPLDTHAEVQNLTAKVSRLRAFYGTLAHINSVITRVRDPQSLFKQVCEIAIEFGAFRTAWIGLVEQENWIRPVAHAGYCEEYMTNLQTTMNESRAEGQGPTGIALRENRIEYIMDLQNDPRTRPWRAKMIQCGFKSSVAAPLHRDGTPIGVFTLYAGETNVFGHEEIQLVKEMASAISFAIKYLEHDRARIQAEADAHFLAYYDHLTKLHNRASLQNLINNTIQGFSDTKKSFVIALLDLDGFKEVNDSQGHAAGDKLLQEVAQRLQHTLAGAEMLARLGGDEFVFVLDSTESHVLVSTLNDVRQALKKPIYLEGRTWRLNCSIGIAFYEGDQDADALLRKADIAMYDAKRKGRDQYSFFEDHLVRKQEEDERLREELEKGIHRNELCLYYQPQVNMSTGKVIGVEALIRWNHPKRGLLTPNQFLPVIQNYRVINKIGKWVLNEALSQWQRWQRYGLNLKISVNISASQFQSASFIAELTSILNQHPSFPYSQLKLELLEDSITNNFDLVQENIEQCNARGIHVSLDDFGTGYSSLVHLQRLPVQEIKIDQTFVRELLDNARNIYIVTGLLSATLPSPVEVIAEGVEDIETGVLLRRLGCERAQGYAIARPMPAHQLVNWSQRWRSNPAWEQSEPWRLLNIDLPIAVSGFVHSRQYERFKQYLHQGHQLLQAHSAPHHHCDFGQWCNSTGAKRFGHLPEFHEIQKMHDSIVFMYEEISRLQGTGDASIATAKTQSLDESIQVFRHKIDGFIPFISAL